MPVKRSNRTSVCEKYHSMRSSVNRRFSAR